MVIKDLEKLKQLQINVKQIRNICILAHVDHGKTTLADTLISSNGVISQKQAGKLRYLDNRPDEQDRQITMKASNIALYYKTFTNQEFLINLIDSPGHVDFSSEVSAAIRLCDGAIVVVDAVEGVCAQTRICLKQAYDQHLKTVLVLNKLDRLIFEKKMTPEDAYKHLQRVLEQVNAVMGNIFAQDVLAKDLDTEKQISALEDSDDSYLYFDPKMGNVVFGSALDGWGFTIRNFAKQYEKKLGVDAKQLTECLWGDFYYNSKKKTCEKGAFDKGKKPLFVQLILENIWNVYETIEKKEIEKIQSIVGKLEVNYKIQKYVDPKIPIKAIFSQWMPLEHAVFQMVINHTPDPGQLSLNKIQDMMAAMKPENLERYSEETKKLTNDLKSCDSGNENVVVFVSKMFPIPFKLLEMSDKSLKNEDNEFVADDEVLIGFARVFSGVLKRDSEIYVLGPKYDPRLASNGETPHLKKVKIENLYMLMGKNLEPLNEAHAGNVIGIGGLHKYVTKTATLTSNINCPPFNELSILATPILRVAVEATFTHEMPKLVKGLKLLNQVDPCVQVLIQDSGEHVMVTLGEVHLEKCVKDLQDSFAKIQLNVSKPIVPFKETIIPFTNPIVQPTEVVPATPATVAEEVEKSISIQTSNKNCTIKILAQPLSQAIVEVLEKNREILKIFLDKTDMSSNQVENLFLDMKKTLGDLFEKEFNGTYKASQIWSIGPKKNATCLLLNATEFQHNEFFSHQYVAGSDPRCNYENAFVNGFHTAVQTGPLCHEPMHGVCFIVQEWKIEEETQYDGTLSGQIITAVKEGCKRAFQVQPQRLVAPMYNCNIIVNSSVLGLASLVLVSSKTFICEFEGSRCILRSQKFQTHGEYFDFEGTHIQKQRISKMTFVECEIDTIPSVLFSVFPKLNEINIEMSKISSRSMSTLVKHLRPIKKLEIGGGRNLMLEERAFDQLQNMEELVLVVLFLDALPRGIFDKNRKLKYIHLGNNNIRKLDDNLLAHLDHLETFIISKNKLETLPIILFKNNRQLKQLDLAGNQIDKINESLLQNLQKLEVLNLAGNQLEVLPQNLFQHNRNLKIVDLHSNRLRMLSSTIFSSLSSLNKLDLAGNQCIDKLYRHRRLMGTLRNDLEVCNQNCVNYKFCV